MAMDNGRIEELGVSGLKTFILGNEKLKPIISSNDKTPLWDGVIHVYSSSKHSIQNLIGQIPIQVKSSEKKLFRKKSHPFSRVSLEKYLGNGGVMLFFVTVTEKGASDFGYKVLLPIDLRKILKGSIKQSYTIKADLISNPSELEKICLFFLEQKGFQGAVNTFLETDQLKLSGMKFALAARSDVSFRESILSGNYYPYAISEYSQLIPCDLVIGGIIEQRASQISVGNKVYFRDQKIMTDINRITRIFLNPALEFELNLGSRRSINFKLFEGKNPAVTCKDYLIALEFLVAMEAPKEFSIDSVRIQIQSMKSNLRFSDLLDRTKTVKELLTRFRINFDELSVTSLSEVEEKSETINNLIYGLLKNGSFRFKNQQREAFLKRIDLFEKSILLLFIKNQDGSFYMVNFNEYFPHEDQVQFTRDGVHYPINKYLAITNPFLLKGVELFLDEVKRQLFSSFQSQSIEFYTWFILGCLHVYDTSGNKEFLSLASEIIDFIIPKLEAANEFMLINRIQIEYRSGGISKDGIRTLVEIRQKNISASLNAACELLLENRGEFERLFSSFSNKEKSEFVGYPIYNLYRNMLKDNS